MIFRFVSGVKGQKTVQNDIKFFLSRFISQETYIIWLSFMVQLCKMIIPLGVFIIFSKFRLFGLSRLVSQELYVTCFPFMIHLCKMIISPEVLFSFSKFWFFGLLGGKRVKNGFKVTKNCVRRAPYFRNHTAYDCHLWYTRSK